jgi:hypothetical protein
MMQLSPLEIMRRCESILDAAVLYPENLSHTRFAINVYLSVSHYLGDIDESVFKILIASYSKRIDKMRAAAGLPD